MFGHRYREIYEDQIANDGEVHTMASLYQPETWSQFVGMVVLSGIVGNAAYDLVKRVVKRITQQIKTPFAGKSDSEIDQHLAILFRHYRDYLDSPEKIEPRVLEYIREEERAHLLEQATELGLRDLLVNDTSRDLTVIRLAIRGALKKIKAGDTSVMDRSKMQRMLADLWNQLPPNS